MKTAVPVTLLLLLGGAALAQSAPPLVSLTPRSAQIFYGRRIAAENCGVCHAVADGDSSAPGAPPFRELYKRYGSGGVVAALQEGMIADNPAPLEEGQRPMHPAMPRIRLDPDQLAALTAFLESLDPKNGA